MWVGGPLFCRFTYNKHRADSVKIRKTHHKIPRIYGNFYTVYGVACYSLMCALSQSTVSAAMNDRSGESVYYDIQYTESESDTLAFSWSLTSLRLNEPHSWQTRRLQSTHTRPMPSANLLTKHRRHRRRSARFTHTLSMHRLSALAETLMTGNSVSIATHLCVEWDVKPSLSLGLIVQLSIVIIAIVIWSFCCCSSSCILFFLFPICFS